MAIISYNYVAPDNLNTQLRIPSSLLAAANALEMLKTHDSGEGANAGYSEEIEILKRKSVELAEKTMKRFPDEGRAYGQLAFVLYRTGGDKKKVSRLYRRCIDLDQSASFCKDGYQAVHNQDK